MTDREAMQMALGTLIKSQPLTHTSDSIQELMETIRMLRQALAQPEQEPQRPVKSYTGGVPRYATDAPKPEWIGLTEEESSDIYNAHHNTYGECITSAYELVLDVEAKLKEKNNG